MNIIAYLAHGGPFNENVLRIYGTSSTTYNTMNDIAYFHHPLAITDVQGTLFVIDNWTFGTYSTSTYSSNPISGPGYTSEDFKPLGSIWMLRAFEDNGTAEIPLGYSTNDTLIPFNAVVAQQVNPFLQNTGYKFWPPFGQPLTANIALPSGVSWATLRDLRPGSLHQIREQGRADLRRPADKHNRDSRSPVEPPCPRDKL